MPPAGKALSLYLLCPVLGLVAGWASVKMGEGGREHGRAALPLSSSSRHREAREAVPAAERDELVAAARRIAEAEKRMGKGNIAEYVADWTDEEILAALEEAVKSPDALLRYQGMAVLLAEEYARRDPDGALAWVMAQSAIHRQKLAPKVIAAWPPERADEALAFVAAHRDVFGTGVPYYLLDAVVSNAAAEGPEALVSRLRGLLEEGFNPRRGMNITFPPGFDFAGLLGSAEFRNLGMAAVQSEIARGWARQDRDAAFRWLLKNNGPMRAITMLNSWDQTPAEVRWLVGQLESLPAEQQEDFIRQGGAVVQRYGGNPNAWIEAAETPRMRDAMRTAAVRMVFGSSDMQMDRGLRALTTLPDPEARVRMLETLEPDGAHASSGGPLHQGAEKILRARLKEWGADRERAEAIVRRISERGKHSGP